MSGTTSTSAGTFLFRPRSWRRVLRFAGFATAAALSPSTYNPQAREVAVRQIYLTAWQILPGYAAITALLSLLLIEVVVGSARRYGVTQYSLELVLRVLVLELVPLMTALFVALRSGAAIGAEIALMCVRGELEDTEEVAASPLHAELVPRIAGAALSVASLTTLGCLVAVWLAYVEFYGFTSAGQPEFSHIVSNVFDGLELASFCLKCLLFGLAVAIIPAATALEAERGVIKSLPAVVLGGLIKLFFVILAVEAATLVVKYV
ncbi:MAG TPA: ABC transporter permease [Burkholderiales bacterium]|jgi:phospholipid/cholesterol/gamma-HCH transport system permease protein